MSCCVLESKGSPLGAKSMFRGQGGLQSKNTGHVRVRMHGLHLLTHQRPIVHDAVSSTNSSVISRLHTLENKYPGCRFSAALLSILISILGPFLGLLNRTGKKRKLLSFIKELHSEHIKNALQIN